MISESCDKNGHNPCKVDNHISCEVKVKVTQLCPAVCDPMNYTVHGIFQGRILEWVAFPFSRGSSQPRSPTLKAASLPAEPRGKPYYYVIKLNYYFVTKHLT